MLLLYLANPKVIYANLQKYICDLKVLFVNPNVAAGWDLRWKMLYVTQDERCKMWPKMKDVKMCLHWPVLSEPTAQQHPHSKYLSRISWMKEKSGSRDDRDRAHQIHFWKKPFLTVCFMFELINCLIICDHNATCCYNHWGLEPLLCSIRSFSPDQTILTHLKSLGMKFQKLASRFAHKSIHKKQLRFRFMNMV